MIANIVNAINRLTKAIQEVSIVSYFYNGIFADIFVEDGITAQAIPTGAIYTKLTGFTNDGIAENVTPDFANNKITLTKKGRYLVNNSFSAGSGTNNVTFKYVAFLNGVEQDQIHAHRKYSVAGDLGSSSMCGIINVDTVPIDIDIRTRHDNAGSINLTPTYANLCVVYLGEI